MNVHSLRYAARTLIGPWVALPATVLEVLNFFQRGMPWRGETLWTVDWFAISLFIIGPLIAGAAAVDASRLTRPGNIHLVVGVSRPHRPYLRAAAWCAGPVAAVHLLAILAGLALGGFSSSTAWFLILTAILVQILAIGWYVAIGSAIGRFASPLIAGAGAALGSFTLIYLLGEGGKEVFEPLALGGATVSRLGYEYDPGYLLAQVAVFGGTGILLLILPIRMRSGVRVPTAVGLSLALAVAGVIAAGPYTFPSDRLTASPKAPTRCTGAEPTICLYPEHERFEAQLVGHIQTLSGAAKAKGYPYFVPNRVEEISRTYRVNGKGTLGLDIQADAYATGTIDIADVAVELVRPLHCEQLYTGAPPGEAYWQREMSLHATLLSLAGLKVNEEDYPQQIKILSPEQVRAIFADYDRCDLEGA
ncbi:hypothetical protein ACIGHB_31115 [Streptomyces sp. NPDC085460]|uniref:hypothetical protein n=1 Tax=Streptomyces sp. NPDC085460 TaxID=3365723 RepID=UPI0037D6730C